MKRTKVVDAFDASLYGTKVNVKGWVRTRRGNKNVNFIAVNDGSTIKNIQVVVDLYQIFGSGDETDNDRCLY